MNCSAILAVYSKELRCLFRDRHTVLYSLAVPAFLYPALLLGAFQVFMVVRGLGERKPSRVEARVAPGAEQLAAFLETEGRPGSVVLVPPGSPEEREVRERLGARPAEVDAVVVARDAAPVTPPLAVPGGLEPAGVDLFYSSARDRSSAARGRVEDLVDRYRKERLLEAARALGGGPSYLEPLSIETRSHSTREEVSNHVAALLMPLLMVLMAALGAFYPALETTVGEKERRTLETTLVAPTSRVTQVTGKYLAVSTFSFGSFSLNFASMVITFQHLGSQLSLEGFRLGARAIGVILLAACLLALFLSAVMMLVAFLARSFKEGQSLVTPIYLLAVAPVVVTTNPEIHLDVSMAAVPLFNMALLFRDALEGSLEAAPSLVALGSTAAATALSLWLASRALAREAVATGENVTLGRVLGWVFRRPREEEGVA